MAPDDHTIPNAPNINDTGTEENQFQDPVAPPSVTGEEDVFSGDATTSESPDIDEELKKVGLHGDEAHGPGPLNVDEELQEEVG
ncbi:MAG: hypothetical protein Q7S45_01715 [Candidatus Curtissbacteria bacterium]|nr:hypothetical protein [Candidatus Curtissbacteria bacterium]